MVLTTKALQAINEKGIRLDLAKILGTTEQSIIRYIKANKENGDLTKAVALGLIRKQTGLTDAEILTEQLTEA